MESKSCSKCCIVKPYDQFSRASKEKSGRKSRCKSCISEDVKTFREKNPEVVKEWERRSISKHRDEHNARGRAWYNANKDKAKVTRDAWRERNKEKDLADIAAYKKANSERLKEAERRWNQENPDKLSEKARRYRESNPEKIVESARKWRRQNRHKTNASKSRRIAAQLQATPKWADHSKIQEFYFAANFLGMVTGEWYHVDHMIPIRSELVCGFHCQANLQVIPGKDNQRKGNRYWPDMP